MSKYSMSKFVGNSMNTQAESKSINKQIFFSWWDGRASGNMEGAHSQPLL